MNVINYLLFFCLFFQSCKNTSAPLDTAQVSTTIKDTVVQNTIPEFVFADSDFEVFYNRFKADSAFQLSSVKFPLKGSYSDESGDEPWKKNSWKYMTWDFRAEMNHEGDSIAIIQDTSRFFFGTYCRECGFSFEMEFEKIKGSWFLTYRQENNF